MLTAALTYAACAAGLTLGSVTVIVMAIEAFSEQ